jgi:hypothetical protein
MLHEGPPELGDCCKFRRPMSGQDNGHRACETFSRTPLSKILGIGKGNEEMGVTRFAPTAVVQLLAHGLVPNITQPLCQVDDRHAQHALVRKRNVDKDRDALEQVTQSIGNVLWGQVLREHVPQLG